MHNRKLKYIDLYMVYQDLSNIPVFELPKGYHFELFQDGDEQNWKDIINSSGEALDDAEATASYNKYYLGHEEELKKRCLFIVEDATSKKVGTGTAWFLNDTNPKTPDITANLHWIAIREEYKGKGLSKALITNVMKKMYELGHKGSVLHTQTHTWLAAMIYMSLGWEPTREIDRDDKLQSQEDFDEGWRIVNSEINSINKNNHA